MAGMIDMIGATGSGESFDCPDAAPNGSDEVSSLDKLCIGQRARVADVSTGVDFAGRLMELGVIPGAEVRLCRVAPFGDPMDFEVHGFHLSLRRQEARAISVRIDHS